MQISKGTTMASMKLGDEARGDGPNVPSRVCYNAEVDVLRNSEYPMLQGKTYLDHAGTTLYSRSLIDAFSKDMTSNLFGNPHSASSSSQQSSRRIDDVRLQALHLFNADPNHFDLIFVANATAGVKLVLESFQEHAGGFWYGYHSDSHTSLVGVREAAKAGHHCFKSDEEVEGWLRGQRKDIRDFGDDCHGLFAYPGQSNMNGRRLPLSWTRKLRTSRHGKKVFSLLDAAALVSTSPLDLSDQSNAPDFTVLSFYKMFGFPDLGALIVRKESAAVLQRRRYFGGGTVEMVVSASENWHIRKQGSLHEELEDGTLPIHDIIALDNAITIHQRQFGGFECVASHAGYLADKLYNDLIGLRHYDGVEVCCIYKSPSSTYTNVRTQGPIIALNLRNSGGEWISNTEFEKLASLRNIEIRSGGLCNPGGIASALILEPWEMRRNFSAGQRCGNENDILGGKPTGVLRVSLGAMSNLQDIETFSNFIEEFFVDRTYLEPIHSTATRSIRDFFVETLTIYPIKSCGGWSVPTDTVWDVRKEGLLWDREWCLVHKGTGTALSQKSFPKMALLKPSIDVLRGLLRVRYHGAAPPSTSSEISVPLSADPSVFEGSADGSHRPLSKVCGDNVNTQVYAAEKISNFFTTIVGTQCTLARMSSSTASPGARHTKAHLNPSSRAIQDLTNPQTKSRPLLLANESPILAISRSSLNRLNEQIKLTGGKAADASVFRANLIIAEDPAACPGLEQPYMEDQWQCLKIGHRLVLDVLGGCRRCQMITVDQLSAEKNEEPFVTLAKTRRKDGKVYFGVHTALAPDGQGPTARIKVGDKVLPARRGR